MSVWISLALWIASSMTNIKPSTESCQSLIKVDDADSVKLWRSVNDNVMGGRSSGSAFYHEGHLWFAGSINTNGGGFASIRYDLSPGMLSGTNAVKLEVLQDARTYEVSFRTSARRFGRPIAFRADIRNPNPGSWSQPTVFYSELKPTVFGRPVRSKPFDPDDVRSISIFVADGEDGDFEIALAKIFACDL